MVLRGGRRARGPQRERVEGPGLAGGRSGERQGIRGDGSPERRPSGSAAAALLGLTAGPEPQRFQRRRPHDPPPRARPIKSAPNPLRLRRWLLAHIPGGRRLCSLPRTWRRRRRRGVGGKGRRKTGSAAAAGGEKRRKSRSRWSRRCQSRPSVSAMGPRQCPFLSPIVNITGRLSPWHTLNQTCWPTVPAPLTHSLETSNGKRGLIGQRPPSLPCQHVRLRADTGLAVGGRRNGRVRRKETEDWAEGRGTRMQRDLRPRCRRFRQAFGEAEGVARPERRALNPGSMQLTEQRNGFPRCARQSSSTTGF